MKKKVYKKVTLLRKRDFFTAIESQQKDFTQAKWEKAQKTKSENFIEDIKR